MGLPEAIRAATLRRTSSLTGTDSHPDSRSWPRVAGRDIEPPYPWVTASDGAGTPSRRGGGDWGPAGKGTMQRVTAYIVAMVVAVAAIAVGIRVVASNSST